MENEADSNNHYDKSSAKINSHAKATQTRRPRPSFINFRDSHVKGIEWYKEFLPKHTKSLEIIHFNDVYNIEE